MGTFSVIAVKLLNSESITGPQCLLSVVIYLFMQAMPQLTDRAKLPNIVDPVIRNSMDLKHLYQVCSM